MAGAAPRQAAFKASTVRGGAAQFFAVARDEQQRVVGARAEDEHRENALCLPVELDDVGVGEQVDERGGDANDMPAESIGMIQSTGLR